MKLILQAIKALLRKIEKRLPTEEGILQLIEKNYPAAEEEVF